MQVQFERGFFWTLKSTYTPAPALVHLSWMLYEILSVVDVAGDPECRRCGWLVCTVIAFPAVVIANYHHRNWFQLPSLSGKKFPHLLPHICWSGPVCTERTSPQSKSRVTGGLVRLFGKHMEETAMLSSIAFPCGHSCNCWHSVWYLLYDACLQGIVTSPDVIHARVQGMVLLVVNY